MGRLHHDGGIVQPLKTRRHDLKDYLAELDEILHDNSVETQSVQNKVLALVHNPTQWSGTDVEHHLCTEGHLSIEGTLAGRLAVMAKSPQDEDDEPEFEEDELFYGEFDMGATPNYDRDWEVTPPHGFLDHDHIVVDGNLYTAHKSRVSFFAFAHPKKVVQWETKPVQPQAVILAQEPAMLRLPPEPLNPASL